MELRPIRWENTISYWVSYDICRVSSDDFSVIDLLMPRWNCCNSFSHLFVIVVVLLVGQEPDIPDLIEYMQSGDEVKIVNAAGYLQHLCYSKEYVKDKVR